MSNTLMYAELKIFDQGTQLVSGEIIASSTTILQICPFHLMQTKRDLKFRHHCSNTYKSGRLKGEEIKRPMIDLL